MCPREFRLVDSGVEETDLGRTENKYQPLTLDYSLSPCLVPVLFVPGGLIRCVYELRSATLYTQDPSYYTVDDFRQDSIAGTVPSFCAYI